MIIKVRCVAHNMDNLPPIEFYSFDQVATWDQEAPMAIDPRQGYRFDYEQVECPVDATHHDFAITIFREDGSVVGVVS